ncbi:divalent cation tolerance protein CutA [Streptomyces sp. NBC_00370]|uniref:divalent cation tolerance protein CutA n=1 Tax=Streptomyces sp. NBC_00370 TaxID=2975728 RepID=UPI002E26AA54
MTDLVQVSTATALEAHLLEHHPWDSPEVSAVPIVNGSEKCLSWVATNTAPE